jgi:hypothetical protein
MKITLAARPDPLQLWIARAQKTEIEKCSLLRGFHPRANLAPKHLRSFTRFLSIPRRLISLSKSSFALNRIFRIVQRPHAA